LEPQDRIGHKTWQTAHDGNVRDALTAWNNVDVVLLGDSITEGWRGMSLGLPVPEKKPNVPVFESLFDERRGADFQGLALGIAGDRTYHLLWRMQNGEIPANLQPSVWWISIGTNDFGRDLPHCSPEVVLMGIIRVVKEMQKLRPGSTIVVNSVLPRSEDINGRLVDSKHPDHLTVWQGILEVNRGLRIYCSKLRNVVYYDATSIFVRQDEGIKGVDGMFIPKELMYDFLHPTAEGYKKWGDEIISSIHDLIEASQSEKGRLPLSATWWDRGGEKKGGSSN
jgi:lysophospholipase L1-like esterase